MSLATLSGITALGIDPFLINLLQTQTAATSAVETTGSIDYKSLRHQLQEVTSEKEKLEKELTRTRAHCKDLKEQVERLTVARKYEIKCQREPYERELQDAKNKIDSLKEKIEDLKKIKMNLQNELNSENKNKRSHFVMMQTQVAENKKLNEENKRLKTEIKDLNDVIEGTRKEVSDYFGFAREKITALEEELKKYKDEETQRGFAEILANMDKI